MKNFVYFGLNEAYKRVERLGDRLAEIGAMIDWDAFRPIVGDMFDNRSEWRGRMPRCEHLPLRDVHD